MMKYLIQIHESFIKEMIINTDDVCFLLLYYVMRCNGISRHSIKQKYCEQPTINTENLEIVPQLPEAAGEALAKNSSCHLILQLGKK